MQLSIGNNSYLFQDNGEIKIKTFNNFIDVNKFETKYGLMITEDNGEWVSYLIHKDLCWMISVNSLLKKDNFIYIHGNYNLIKYDLNSKEMEIFTTLEEDQLNTLYLGRFKLIKFWDEIFLEK
ncbi:hypothetical protein [Methanobrevibacter smithii]|jgi:hypothetical protein|uniref:hypothetical protein n=1 Tax=Methanobrevibacter smithii TaxID=2173 RepID=UPI0037DC1D62